ncbi:MAG: sigma-70 family RNA polymerase sigma factor [Oscillospiraceae bacterium]|nr:sigma-70 family RNA polymerase sigma factor [Oscillospiraceae bacterium]
MNKSVKSIEAMAEEIRRGDYTDFGKLLHLCAYIPKETLDEALKQGYEKEDIYQESVIAFLHALHTFDEDRGAGFRTYASLCIRNHLVSLLRSGRRQKNAAMLDYVSIDEADVVFGGDPEEDWIEKEEFSDLKKRIFSALSNFEGEVLRLYLNGFSYKAIGEKLGKTEKSVGNALSRVRKKLRSEK